MSNFMACRFVFLCFFLSEEFFFTLLLINISHFRLKKKKERKKKTSRQLFPLSTRNVTIIQVVGTLANSLNLNLKR